jgi:hypothetical protein
MYNIGIYAEEADMPIFLVRIDEKYKVFSIDNAVTLPPSIRWGGRKDYVFAARRDLPITVRCSRQTRDPA